jgi:hypothetical protein
VGVDVRSKLGMHAEGRRIIQKYLSLLINITNFYWAIFPDEVIGKKNKKQKTAKFGQN